MRRHIDFFTKLKDFDAYPKTLEDFRVRTFSGAAGKKDRPNFSARKLNRHC